MKYLVNIKTPGILLDIPGLPNIRRTPLQVIVDEIDIEAVKNILRIGMATDYTITEVSDNLVEEPVQPTFDIKTKEKKKKSTSLDLNIKIKT